MKKKILFSSLLTFLLKTIPEEEKDYIFNSSSDEIEAESLVGEYSFEVTQAEDYHKCFYFLYYLLFYFFCFYFFHFYQKLL